MITEDITLVCRHCGAETVKHLGWVQAHRNFQCEHCGRVSKLDKDWLSLALAGRKPASVARPPLPTARVPAKSDPSA